MLLFSCIVSPVECLDNLITDLTNEEGEVIGIEYNGSSQYFEYGKYIYPTLRIKIYREDKEVLLDSANLNLVIYNIVQEEEVYLSEIYPNYENNYFIYNVENNDPPQIRKFKLKEFNQETNSYIEYELEKSIVKYNGYGELEYININLKTVDPEAGGGNEEGIISVLKDIFNIIKNFITGFIGSLINGIIEAVKVLLIPPDHMMDIILDDIYNKIISQLPILDLPFQFLTQLTEGNATNWIRENCLIEWNNIELFNIELIPAGSFNMADFINSNPAFTRVRQIWIWIYNGTLSIFFIGYLQKKFNEIFR